MLRRFLVTTSLLFAFAPTPTLRTDWGTLKARFR